MKVSIATLYGANNVGAFLQAYALQMTMESFVGEGNCQFWRLPSSGNGESSKIKKAWNYLKQGHLRTLWFKYKSVQKYKEAVQLLNLDPDPFSIDNIYDTVIVGSDEVWNLESSNFVHHDQYFAKGIRAKNIIAYAPSAGNCTIAKMRMLGVDFSGFQHLSVRDENAYSAVYEIDGRIPEYVCDPTFLPESFDAYIKPVPRENYILVYSYGLGTKDIKQIKQYARSRQKKLISVGTFNAWCDENIVVGPVEFLSWLQGADEVITSTFHGTLLSLRLHKQVGIIANDSHKIIHVLRQLDLERRNVSSIGELSLVMQETIDYDEVETKIAAMRTRSLQYLKKALGLSEE